MSVNDKVKSNQLWSFKKDNFTFYDYQNRVFISAANVNKDKIKSIVYISKKKLNNIIQKLRYYRIKLKFLKIKSTN